MSSKVFISKSALVHNLRAYRRAVGGQSIMAIVKANAYGHGLIEVARTIEKEADWFGVAAGQEALLLRRAGASKPILVLSFYDPGEISELVRQKVSLAVYELDQAKQISQAAKKLKRTARIHLKVDTGTARLGVFPNQIENFVKEIEKLRNLEIEGVFSHFASSEDNLAFTKKQNDKFDAVIYDLKKLGIDPIKHIACTAAGFTAPDSRHDMVRLGLGLYGLWPSVKARQRAKFDLQPALSWQSHIIQIKDLPRGASVGYGQSYVTKRPTKLAVLPVGYFDGMDRKLSNLGEIAVNGQRCKILGRVCMNLLMIDLTDLKHTKVGDKAELIGPTITADEVAQKIGTINYEVVTRINPLIPRILK